MIDNASILAEMTESRRALADYYGTTLPTLNCVLNPVAHKAPKRYCRVRSLMDHDDDRPSTQRRSPDPTPDELRAAALLEHMADKRDGMTIKEIGSFFDLGYKKSAYVVGKLEADGLMFRHKFGKADYRYFANEKWMNEFWERQLAAKKEKEYRRVFEEIDSKGFITRSSASFISHDYAYVGTLLRNMEREGLLKSTKGTRGRELRYVRRIAIEQGR